MLGPGLSGPPTGGARAPRGWLVAIGAAAGLALFGSSRPAAAETLVAAWEFDQVSGVVQDLTPGDNDLTLSGRWSSVTGSGADQSVVRFEATPATAATTAANGAHFNPGTGPFALTVRLRASKDVTSGSPNVAQHGLFGDPGQIKMQIAANGRLGCRIKGNRTAYLYYHQTSTMNDNLWHTVTCARSGTDLTVTVDGVVSSPSGSENPGSIAVTGAPFRFAQKTATSTSAADQFIGDIGYASYSQ